MAASKLFSLLGPSILRSNSLIFARPHHVNLIFSLNSSSRWCSSSALAIDSDNDTATTSTTHDALTSVVAAAAAAPPPHPWPEWVSFVDRLKTKGYISPTQNDELVYTDVNAVKDACLKFARQHFHIFKSLSTQDIQTTVGNSCPNLMRKVVNSAKRLRKHVELNESKVCGSCDLRGSCNRADIMLLTDSEPARTVDIVRILYVYALDPAVMSGGNKPPGGELVEASVRKLLLELIELGETDFDPEILQRASVTATTVTATKSKKTPLNLSKTGSQIDNPMRPRDWLCSGCNYVNFARNIQCLICKADNPNPVRKLKLVSEKVEKKPGDWDCPKCSFMNYASRKQCARCPEPRPGRVLERGQWECPKCDCLNYKRDTSCKKCNHEPTLDTSIEHDLPTWKRPY